MKKISVIILFFAMASAVFAQHSGYYNGTDGKSGEELKTALNDIIKDHTQYFYYFADEIFKLSDADPNNPENVIQVYTGFSHDNSDYGNSGLELNREHVWAKSHGNFADKPPMYDDVHNLKPASAKVNQDKSNLDFDNGGEQHDIATGCYLTDSTWEARDEVKGDIARIIFYMSTRYEGNDGESDLEVVDHNNTYPLPEHGKLSTLLEWNQLDPPDEFERNRNDVIYSFQKNRNPFIDDPGFADLIWGNAIPNPIYIDNVSKSPEIAVANEPVHIDASVISTAGGSVSAKVVWGLSFDNLISEITMTGLDDIYSATIPGQAEDATVYYKIVATAASNENSTVIYNYYVPKIFTGNITSIYDIQGQQADSPFDGQVVSTTGVVTGNFGSNYFIQDGTGGWNGLFIYELGRNPSIGDSIVITGEIDEYYNKTEMVNIEDYYYISSNNELPAPVIVQTGAVQEQHESILVQIINAECTNDDPSPGNYSMWVVNDGSGELKIHNTPVFEYFPEKGSYYNITGPMNYDFDEWKVELRFESDVTEGGDSEGPFVEEVTPVIITNIKIIFNESVEATSAENIENYIINNGVNVVEALQNAINKKQVNLTVSPLEGDYEITVQNIEDPSGNVMQPQTISFSYLSVEELLFDGDLKVFPNPTEDQLTIQFNSKKDFKVDVSCIDITGRKVISEDYAVSRGKNKLNFDLKEFGQGIYFLHITDNKKTLSYKVVVK